MERLEDKVEMGVFVCCLDVCLMKIIDGFEI